VNARARWLLAFAVLAGSLAALAAAAPAGAHGYLVETSPPNESVVPRAPREVRLVFNEKSKDDYLKALKAVAPKG